MPQNCETSLCDRDSHIFIRGRNLCFECSVELLRSSLDVSLELFAEMSRFFESVNSKSNSNLSKRTATS